MEHTKILGWHPNRAAKRYDTENQLEQAHLPTLILVQTKQQKINLRNSATVHNAKFGWWHKSHPFFKIGIHQINHCIGGHHNMLKILSSRLLSASAQCQYVLESSDDSLHCILFWQNARGPGRHIFGNSETHRSCVAKSRLSTRIEKKRSPGVVVNVCPRA